MGKGGGKAHTPVEAADNLKSKQQLSVIDLLCEGEIEGPIDGLRSVYLNDTPVQAPDGSYNFKGLEAEWTAGTQSQEPLSGFPSTENEVPVNLEVKNTTPIVRTITDSNVDRVRVTVGISALYKQEDNGDINGSLVNLQVQIGSGDSWRTVENVSFEGKSRSQYLRSVIINDLPEVPFNIRVLRTTADSTSSMLVNSSLWSSYTEIYDIKLAYPNTAVVGMKFDSEQFNGIPRRNYLIKGMIVSVPDNYDPETRSYSGLWMGNFKPAWTDNPAWILYDLLTNKRYGLGNRVGSFGVDKFMLYTIGQYCDQLVDDGFGNKEPRFTCNCYITEQRQAYSVISDLCSIFRAMPVWDGSQLTAIIDRPADTVAIYTNANVVDGTFSYSSSAQKDRHTAVHVRYVDPNNGWETVTEYVADDNLIKRYGLNIAQVDAFGCTSRGQAHRVGKWLVQTEKLEKQTVTFSIGREGIKHLPGDIIGIADNGYVGAKVGGRFTNISGNTVELDHDVEISDISNAFLTYTNKQSELVKVQIQAQVEPNKLTLFDDIEADDYSVWMLTNMALKPRLFKALSIAENDDGTYSVIALQHEPQKEAVVDAGAIFEGDTNSLYQLSIPPVERLQVEVTPESDSYQARLSWSTPRTINDLKFEVKVLRDDKLVSREIVNDTEYYMTDLSLGQFNAQVRGMTNDGKLGDESAISFSISPPSKPAQIQLTPSNFSVSIKPLGTGANSLGTQYEFYKGLTQEEVENKVNYLGRAITMIDADCEADTEYWYGVNAINSVGRSELTIANTRTLLAENGAGGIFRIQTNDGIFLDNDEATALFLSHFGFYPARDTTLIIYSLDVNGQVSHSEARMYNGSKWIEPAMFLDGDLIAEGTIRGDRLIAGTEIKAPKIIGGEVIAGTVVSSGTPPAFELLEDGTLNARKANITGQVNASSGVLDNVVINESCVIKKLTVDQIEGDISKSYILKNGDSITVPAVSYDRVLSIPSVICSCSSFPYFTASATAGVINVLPLDGKYSMGYAKVLLNGNIIINIRTEHTRMSIVKQQSHVSTIQKGNITTISFESASAGEGSAPSSLYIVINRM